MKITIDNLIELIYLFEKNGYSVNKPEKLEYGMYDVFMLQYQSVEERNRCSDAYDLTVANDMVYIKDMNILKSIYRNKKIEQLGL